LAKLTPSFPQYQFEFGYAVAISAHLAVVGVPGHASYTGTAVVFDWTTGQELARLLPLGANAGDRVGSAVTIDGTRVVVGSGYADGASPYTGAAYEFSTDGSFVRSYRACDGQSSDSFGSALGLHGDMLIVGAPADDDFGDLTGSAYLFHTDSSLGTPYCGPANLNSAGVYAELAARGHAAALDNCASLEVTKMPPGQIGMLMTSQTQGFTLPPGSQGNLCLGGAIGRYTDQLFQTGPEGRYEAWLDLKNMPQPGGFVSAQPGETWNFQVWFRDNNPGPTSNFTDAVAITFE
jgi:FG-GAP repeat protein